MTRIPNLPAHLNPRSVKILIDSREQQPWQFPAMRTETATLQTGDYTVAGCEDIIRIERKSLPDLIGCIGQGRARFQREIERLKGFACPILAIESSWPEIDAGEWRGKITPKMIRNSLASWAIQGITISLTGTRERAELLAADMLYLAARKEYRRCRTFAAGILEASQDVA